MVNPALYKSDKDTWMTPKGVATQVENVFCDGYLDPAPPIDVNPYMMKSYCPERFNGLQIDWQYKNVYVNPPYGREISKWTKKFKDEFYKGNFENGIMLVPGRLGSKWFQDITHDSSCWCALNGRLTFVGAPSSAPFPSVLVLYTTSIEFLYDFMFEFKESGELWKIA